MINPCRTEFIQVCGLLVEPSMIWSRGDLKDHCLSIHFVLACEDDLGLFLIKYKGQDLSLKSIA